MSRHAYTLIRSATGVTGSGQSRVESMRKPPRLMATSVTNVSVRYREPNEVDDCAPEDLRALVEVCTWPLPAWSHCTIPPEKGCTIRSTVVAQPTRLNQLRQLCGTELADQPLTA
jgi:hypothetical protein